MIFPIIKIMKQMEYTSIQCFEVEHEVKFTSKTGFFLYLKV